MTHLPYIVASYGLTAGVALWLSIGVAWRTRMARRRLLAVDPRADRRTGGRTDERTDRGTDRRA